MPSPPPPGVLQPVPPALALTLAMTLALAPSAGAQEEDEAPPIELDPLVVTPTLSERPRFDAPQSVAVVDGLELERHAYRTLPQALRYVSGVMVQETAHGHGSPYLRGFTGFRNVLLIDGVRLNNSVFRAGPNQYWNTIDPYTLEDIEVAMGPGSVLYGSDAIGGTVLATTKEPWGYGGGSELHGAQHYFWADAENRQELRTETSATFGTDTGVLAGVSLKDFGDLHGGEDVGLQRQTGYDETDADLKVVHFLDEHTKLVVAHQHVEQHDVPRTHRTVFGIDWEGLDVGKDLRREFDQKRELTYVQLHATELDGWLDDLSVSLSWHVQDEERDRIKSSGARELQGFEVGTLGLVTHLRRASAVGNWTFGLEYYRDEVDSFLDRGGAQSPADDIQGPVADDASYDLLGVFVQDELDLGERLDLVLGTRWNHAAADADEVRDPVTDQRISIDEDWSTVVGSARLVYALVPGSLNLFGGVSQGFRAPNLSDLTRFDSARTDEFEVPAPDLEPERTTTVELGVRRRTEHLSAEAAVFYTDIEDGIVRVPTGNVNADGDFEVTKDNVGDGYVYGIELGAAWRLEEEWTLFGNAAFLEGKQDTFPSSSPVREEEYLDRLMPLNLRLGLRWEDPGGRFWSEALMTWADEADKLSTRDESDTSRIPAGGTPDYTVLDLRAGWRVSEGIALRFGVLNLTDEDYRVHGSGLNRPGRNLYFGASFSF